MHCGRFLEPHSCNATVINKGQLETSWLILSRITVLAKPYTKVSVLSSISLISSTVARM